MTIVAESFSPDVTSDIAAGYWRPYLLSDPRTDVLRLRKVAASVDARLTDGVAGDGANKPFNTSKGWLIESRRPAPCGSRVTKCIRIHSLKTSSGKIPLETTEKLASVNCTIWDFRNSSTPTTRYYSPILSLFQKGRFLHYSCARRINIHADDAGTVAFK